MCCLSGGIAPTISLAMKSDIMGFRLHLGDCLLRGKIPLLVLVKPTRLLPRPATWWSCILSLLTGSSLRSEIPCKTWCRNFCQGFDAEATHLRNLKILLCKPKIAVLIYPAFRVEGPGARLNI